MDDLTILPCRLKGTLAAPPSKSVAHRALICAALSGGPCRVGPVAPSMDMEATLRCLSALGFESRREGETVFFEGRSKKKASGEIPLLDCAESGSTLRFLLPVAQAAAGGGVFVMRGGLGRRPLTPYENIWKRQETGFAYEAGPAPGERRITVSGPLKAGAFELPGNISSQFITGLLLALPLLKGDSSIHILPPLESEGYVRLTLQAMEAFLVRAERPDALTFRIPGGQRYQARDVRVEGDYSQAAVFLCAAALGHEVKITGLYADSCQGDRVILEWLRLMGARLREEKGVIAVQGGTLHGLQADGGQCPDILPMLALTCCLARGESRIRNCGRLRIKECDRLAATVELLNQLGADIRAEGEDMVIVGRPSLHGGGTADCRNDHRMAMMLSIAALHCQKPLTLAGAGCVAKSWPAYFEDLQKLGAVIDQKGR